MKPGLKRCEHCDGTGSVPDPVYQGKEGRKKRDSKGLTLREVSRRMGLSAGYVSDLELGRRGWNEKLMERYVRALK